jgi:hypothetical protein
MTVGLAVSLWISPLLLWAGGLVALAMSSMIVSPDWSVAILIYLFSICIEITSGQGPYAWVLLWSRPSTSLGSTTFLVERMPERCVMGVACAFVRLQAGCEAAC